MKFKKYKDGYTQIQKVLEALQKDKDSWENKLNAKTKAKEITTKEESLKKYLEDAICSKQALEGKVSDLKDDLVLISGTYFCCVKE